jgi:redox-sensitive bicupin YhaK (pirin superfamily)
LDSIELAIPQRRRSLGGGFEVGRILPFPRRRMIGPFIFFDHMGPSHFPPGIPRSMDVRAHPHIGLSTVTYLFAGEIMHRDSVGSAQAIRPGEVNWMVAGRGISHSERFERARQEGGALHGIQAWVALPREQEEIAPSFAHHGRSDLPEFDADGVRMRLVAGSAFGESAKVAIYSPMFYLHADMDAGARLALPNEYSERALYLVSGSLEVDGVRHEAGQMLVFVANRPAVLRAVEASTVMLLGGEPVGERHIYWNFVSSSQDRIAQAAEDWREGRMKLPDLDHDEFIPLPDDAPRPSNR